ncbi:kinase-like domain-containing protein [Tuber brumale]|nr:kinase-like domain-containing protein [Tuber brumale]
MSDLVESYRLNTEYDGNRLRYSESPARGVVETWSVGEVLGRGSHGVVRKHQEERTGRVRAVKSIEKSKNPFHAREFIIMAILNKLEYRSFFVEFLGWFEDSDRLYIAMEYFGQGDLRRHLNKPLPEDVAQEITKQVLNGLQVMHKNEIAHRDLKPENIFVVSMSPVLVKLGDFGISKRIHSDTFFCSHVCTYSYAAPEVLGIDSTSESSVYTNAVDMWSLGCVVYELLEGARLFCSLGEITNYYYGKGNLLAQKLRNPTTPISEKVKSFIQALVGLDPKGRPSAVEAVSHVWLERLAMDGSTVLSPFHAWLGLRFPGILGRRGTNSPASGAGSTNGTVPTTSLFPSFTFRGLNPPPLPVVDSSACLQSTQISSPINIPHRRAVLFPQPNSFHVPPGHYPVGGHTIGEFYGDGRVAGIGPEGAPQLMPVGPASVPNEPGYW